MAVYILKGIALFGIVYNLVLMYRKQQEMLADTGTDNPLGMTGRQMWEEGKKHWVTTFIIGIIANFFDTLGIGSFAPSSSAFKFTKSVDDILVPGTLNVGDTVPVCIEAFLFFGFVKMDVLTLILMIISAVVGANAMAGVVSKFDRKKVRLAMFVGLFILATIMLCKNLGVGPFGQSGNALGLSGSKLIFAVAVNFVLGALMSIGVGLYAPCMALCALLGLNVGCAFPAMIGSCAYLMAFGNGPKFIKEGRYDMVASWTQAIGGAIGVICAYMFVSSLPLSALTFVVVAVCYVTALLMLKDAIVKESKV